MARPIAVTNTSPIITLAGIGQLQLFDALFERVFVPFEVWAELDDKPGASEPRALLALKSVSFHPPARIPADAMWLDPGERAAVALAAAIPGSWILVDELAARRVGRGLGLRVVGTLGILVEAKRQGLISRLRPLVEHMLANGCRLAPDLVASVLASVDERTE